MQITNAYQYPVYAIGKSKNALSRALLPKDISDTTAHMDCVGPISPTSLCGNSYAFHLIECVSHLSDVRLCYAIQRDVNLACQTWHGKIIYSLCVPWNTCEDFASQQCSKKKLQKIPSICHTLSSSVWTSTSFHPECSKIAKRFD